MKLLHLNDCVMSKLLFQLMVLFMILLLVNSCKQATTYKQETVVEEWIDLFNGNDLTGWIQRNGEAKYTAENGEIVGTTVLNTPNSFLCTEKDYADFILEFEVLVDTALNSGVQIRSHSIPEYNNGRVHGYQIEIDPSDRAWSGGIYDEARRGWLANLENNEEGRKAFKNGEWNKYLVEAIGNTIKVWINDVPTAEYTDTLDDPSGFIGLQVHSTNIDRLMQVKWREIRILVK